MSVFKKRMESRKRMEKIDTALLEAITVITEEDPNIK